jgi:hypothetical protein
VPAYQVQASIDQPELGKPIPQKHRWRFVTLTEFTRTEIEAGAADGDGLLDRHDIADIERGFYLTEGRQQYLRDLLNNFTLANKGD